MHLFNIVIIFVILFAFGFLGYRYFQKINATEIDLDDNEENTARKQDVTIEYLVDETRKAFARTLKQNIADDNLSKDELERKQKRISELREAQSAASNGSISAKKVIINYIKDLLLDEKYEIDERSINEIIPFDDPSVMTSVEQFETILYFYMRVYEEKAFDMLVKDYELNAPIPYINKHMDNTEEQRYKITGEMVAFMYASVLNGESSIEKVTLRFEEKVDIIAQRVYERYIGYGVVDLLYYCNLDEIDCGMSGVPADLFNVSTTTKNLPYSYESVWIVYSGINIQLECIGFEMQEELIRVVNNIYKFNAPYVLSESEGRVVGTMINGSRIVVCRPPFSNSYMFFMRKFDSSPSIKPSSLMNDKNAAIPICLMKWFIKGARNTLITGGQGTGKSTWLKSLVRFINPEYNIRLQELQAELNLQYAYPDRNIVSFQETPTIDAQEALNLQKKTNGTVNIIGEIAEARQASYFIQTSSVASLFGIATHHAKTIQTLIRSFARNLVECGLHSDQVLAEKEVAETVNIDCHLKSEDGKRFIERITEIFPAEEPPYPSTLEKNKAKTEQDKYYMDAREFFRRTTNPTTYGCKNIVEHVEYPVEDGKVGFCYKLVNKPSESMIHDMKEKMNSKDFEEFIHDLEMMQLLSDGTETEEVKTWEKTILSY